MRVFCEWRNKWRTFRPPWPLLYLFDANATTKEQISLFKLICSKNDGLIDLIVLPLG